MSHLTKYGGHGNAKSRRICKGKKAKFRRQMRANAEDGRERTRAKGISPARKSAKSELAHELSGILADVFSDPMVPRRGGQWKGRVNISEDFDDLPEEFYENEK